MSDVIRHVKQRYRSSWKLLVVAYTLFLFTMQDCFLDVQVHHVQSGTYEAFVDDRFTLVWFVVSIVVFSLLLFFHLFRQYHKQSERWLLLPQKRNRIVLGDGVWIIVSLLPCFILPLLLYYAGFSNYLSLLEEHHIIQYAQTHDFTLSLYRCSFTHILYPEDIAEILRNIVCVSMIATVLPCIVTYMVKQQTQRSEAILLIGMGVVFVLTVLFNTTWFTNVSFILLMCLGYGYSANSWENCMIGGLKDARN